ncbi:hypothetical protein KJ980_02350, partial [Patescibacteria group bacterium]|nr:hypothetical protein [Patescibacteria group bacterium]
LKALVSAIPPPRLLTPLSIFYLKHQFYSTILFLLYFATFSYKLCCKISLEEVIPFQNTISWVYRYIPNQKNRFAVFISITYSYGGWFPSGGELFFSPTK